MLCDFTLRFIDKRAQFTLKKSHLRSVTIGLVTATATAAVAEAAVIRSISRDLRPTAQQLPTNPPVTFELIPSAGRGRTAGSERRAARDADGCAPPDQRFRLRVYQRISALFDGTLTDLEPWADHAFRLNRVLWPADAASGYVWLVSGTALDGFDADERSALSEDESRLICFV